MFLLLLFLCVCIHISHIRHMSCFENTGLPGATMLNLRNIIGRARFVSVKANRQGQKGNAMREIYHDNGDVTRSWYGYEEITPGIVALNAVVYAVLALGLFTPATVIGGVAVAVLGALLGACVVAILFVVGGNVKYETTYYANN